MSKKRLLHFSTANLVMKKQISDFYLLDRESYEIGSSSDGEAPANSSKMQVYIVYYIYKFMYMHLNATTL